MAVLSSKRARPSPPRILSSGGFSLFLVLVLVAWLPVVPAQEEDEQQQQQAEVDDDPFASETCVVQARPQPNLMAAADDVESPPPLVYQSCATFAAAHPSDTTYSPGEGLVCGNSDDNNDDMQPESSSCFQLVVVRSSDVITCYDRACQQAQFSKARFVRCLGSESCTDGSWTDGHQLACDHDGACRNGTVSYVQSVACSGYQSCESARIREATWVVCTAEEACAATAAWETLIVNCYPGACDASTQIRKVRSVSCPEDFKTTGTSSSSSVRNNHNNKETLECFDSDGNLIELPSTSGAVVAGFPKTSLALGLVLAMTVLFL